MIIFSGKKTNIFYVKSHTAVQCTVYASVFIVLRKCLGAAELTVSPGDFPTLE